LSDDRAAALALTPVSQETLARLDRYIALLREWQVHTNLIANSTLPNLWVRHVADSLQLLTLAPKARVWVDLGSGAGFPGLAIACSLADMPGAHVHLIESRLKKANFLRAAAEAAGAPVSVHADRVENCVDSLAGKAQIVTARAVASLNDLCDLAFPLVAAGATALFHKGQDIAAELTLASKYWSIQAELLPSITSADGRIVRITGLTRRSARKKK
jgi:16S rRNA (guanine527-N7)-methyltransferase